MNNYYAEEGYCIQEGIPTPDKAVEIKTKVIGKNLLETVEYSQQKEIERLHSIIKEVREYINKNKWCDTSEYNDDYNEIVIKADKVLEILDKVGDEK